MTFIKTTQEPKGGPGRAYYFIFSDNHLLVTAETEDLISIPCIKETSVAEMALEDPCFFGNFKTIPCYCARINPENMPDRYTAVNLRSLYGRIDNGFWSVAGYARQIHDWNMNFKFCGRCGAATQKNKNEHARVCPECGLTSYPRISPAIITAVVKDNQILLARGVNFPNKKMFSVLAGFVEPGETLEDCVTREIFEEVGIKISHIRYFSSQPWPFPDSLMIGFTAAYVSGEISIDRDEILEAGWFTADTLPVIPGKQTLAGQLIEWFVRSQKQPAEPS